MTTVSRTFRINVIAPPPLPAWRLGQSIGEWREIPNTAMSLYPPSVNPGNKRLSAKFDSWNGLCIDTRDSKVWNLASGGHGDYIGNDVQVFTLGDNAPKWIEILPSSPLSAYIADSDRYADGRPTSSHTYWSQHVIESRNLAVRFGIGSAAGGGAPRKAVDGFDTRTPIGSDGWTAPGFLPAWGSYNTDAPTCKDPLTEDVYMFHENYSVQRWQNSSNTRGAVHTQFPPNTMKKAACAFDGERRRILLASRLGSWTFSPATGRFTAHTLIGDHAAMVLRDQQAMVYVAELDAYLVVGGDNPVVVYRVDPETFEVSVLPTTGTPAPAIPGSNGGGNPYSRFLYAPALGGCAWFPTYTANCWFLRTH